MNENYLELKERKLSILGCNWEGTGDLGGNETHFYPEPSCKVWLLTMCRLFSLRKINSIHFCLYDLFLYRVYKEIVKYPGQDKNKVPNKIRKPRNTDRYSFYRGLGVILHVLFTWVALSVFSTQGQRLSSQEGVCSTVGVGWSYRRPEEIVTRFRHHPSENRAGVTCNSGNKKE